MFCEDIVHKNVERSNDQATVVVGVDTDQRNLTAQWHILNLFSGHCHSLSISTDVYMP